MVLAQPPLTAREAQVAELAVRGFPSKEIANLLVLSPHTIHSHLRRIFGKCEVRNRAQLVAWWFSREQPGAEIAGGFVRGSRRTESNTLEKLSRPRLVGAGILLISAVIALSQGTQFPGTSAPSVAVIAQGAETYTTSGGLHHINGGETVVCDQAEGAEGVVYNCPLPPADR